MSLMIIEEALLTITSFISALMLMMIGPKSLEAMPILIILMMARVKATPQRILPAELIAEMLVLVLPISPSSSVSIPFSLLLIMYSRLRMLSPVRKSKSIMML